MGRSGSVAIVVAVGHEPWPDVRRTLDPVLREAEVVGAQLVIATSNDESLREHYPAATLVAVPGADVFALRAAALRELSVETVLVTEDHCIVPEGWAAGLLDALQRHPDADASVPALSNGATGSVVDWANFLSWFSPSLAPVDPTPDNPPLPASNLAVRMRALEVARSPGYLEVQLVPRLFAEGRVCAAPGVEVVHDQSLGRFGTFVHAFQNGRASYAMLPRHQRVPAVRQLLALPRHAARFVSTTRTYARRQPELAPVVCRALPLVALVGVCHAAGVAAAIVAGAGRSAGQVR